MNNNDSGAGSLRQAILDASSGDTIDFAPGVTSPVALTSGELAISKNLTITGPGAATLAVDANHNSRIFKITGSGVTVSISGLTLTNGYYHQGLVDPHGGSAIFNAADLVVSDCVFTSNGVSSAGNYTDVGGAIENDASLTIDESVFRDNHSADGGGAIYNFQPTGDLTIANTTFDQNSAYYAYGDNGAGGAIYNLSGSVSIGASTFSSNLARDGGAILDTGSASDTVLNCTFSGNTATGWGQFGGEGGAISSNSLTVTSSTLSDNVADSGTMHPGYGGGIYGSFSAKNSIVAGNSAASDPDVWGGASLGHNLIGDVGDTGASWNTSNGDIFGTDNSPLDPKLNPLADNGGPTLTYLPESDSPAIGAGDPTDAPDYDQRGPCYPRVVNGQMDIGSIESEASGCNGPTGPEVRSKLADVRMSARALATVLSSVHLSAAQGIMTPIGDSPMSGKSTVPFGSGVRTPNVAPLFLAVQKWHAAGGEDQHSLDAFFHVFSVRARDDMEELISVETLATDS